MSLIIDGTTGISASGNITGGNIISSGAISVTGALSVGSFTPATLSTSGNITGNYIFGNGSQLTGIDATSIQNGTANVRTFNNGNVTTSAAGTANVVIVTSTGTITTGTASVTGNVVAGNLLINNNAVITGNLSVQGTETIFNVANLTVNDKDIIVANNVTGGANVDGSGIQAGNPATATWFFNNATTSWQSNIGITPTTNGTLSLGGASNYWGTAFITTASVTGNVQGGNLRTAGVVSATGNITGNYIFGNGSQLTGIDATSIQSGTSNVRVVSSGGNVATGIGGTANVVVVATTGQFVTGVSSVSGNITGGNLITGGLISATGAITGAALTGTSLTVSTGNITGGNLLLSGAIVDSAQLDIQTSSNNSNIALAPNGTGLVTVSTQLSAVGNVTGGNIRTAGLISATGTITGSSFSGAGTGLTGTASSLSVGSATTAGTVTTAAQPNITSVGTLSSVSVTGNVQGGNILTAGLISATGAITGAALTGTSLTVSTGNVSCGNIVNTNGNGVGNIGSASLYFNTVFAKATSAQYADLAEMYVADLNYEPGTVLEFGGNQEVTASNETHSTRVAGIVSTNPSYLMNAAQQGIHVVAVALVGRVPCRVVGKINKGDRLVSSSILGTATVLNQDLYQPGSIIGKALESYDSDQPGVIEVAVGRT